MAGIIKTSINLAKIPKDKIIDGAKGKYLPITITVNDEYERTMERRGRERTEGQGPQQNGKIVYAMLTCNEEIGLKFYRIIYYSWAKTIKLFWLFQDREKQINKDSIITMYVYKPRHGTIATQNPKKG